LASVVAGSIRRAEFHETLTVWDSCNSLLSS